MLGWLRCTLYNKVEKYVNTYSTNRRLEDPQTNSLRYDRSVKVIIEFTISNSISPILFNHFFHVEMRWRFTDNCKSKSLVEGGTTGVDF